ncbi:MAG TPA: CoA pyrophosphatase [Polyangiaceae bacterium]
MSEPSDLARVRAALARRSSLALELPRRAAVALLLTEQAGSLAVLLVRRAERAGDPWSGHMALPGGHFHDDDGDLLVTARRETHEEVGLDLGGAELLGSLDDITPLRSSGLAVRPFVFWLSGPVTLGLSPEVSETHWVALEVLAQGSLREMREVEVQSQRLSVPAYVIEQRVVWGMTFRLLEDFLARIGRPV